MIKQLLFSSLLLVPCAQSMAQSIKKADNVTMYNLSENGKYACASKEGIATLWNTEKDNELTTFNDDYYYCDCVSNDGLMAGSIGAMGKEKPIVYTAEKIIYLPMPEDRVWAYGSARGISSDGKMVCGLLSDGSVNIMDNVTAIIPFVWEFDGDNITCTELPYPEKDFTGRYPQGFHPLIVSEDKNCILGREIDYSGMSGVFIVWNRTAPGEPWTYKILGEDIIYKDGPEFPEFPDEPQKVNYEDYMTEEELEAYNKAYDDWWNGEILGDAPEASDYINDPEKKEAYIEAYNKYQQEQSEYTKQVFAFMDIYYQRRTDYTFNVYSFSGSCNGRYVGCTLEKSDTSTGFPQPVYYPCYYDLENDKFISLEEDQYKNYGIGVRITDNGDVVISNPAKAVQYNARNSFVIPAGQDKAVPVYEFLGSKNDGKINRQTFVDAGFEFSWEGYDPETYDPIEIKDSLLVGTAMLSADGKNAVGFNTDPSTLLYGCWALNNFVSTGITSAKVNNNTEAVLRSNVIENGTIEFVADVEKATLFDLNGAKLYSCTPAGNSMTVPANKGIYVLMSKLKNGTVRTDKIIIK